MSDKTKDGLLAELARKRAAADKALAEVAGTEAALNQMDAAERAEADRPKLTPIRSAGEGYYFVVQRPFGGPNGPLDSGALVSADEAASFTNWHILGGSGYFQKELDGRLRQIHPRAVEKTGRQCATCSAFFVSESTASAHWVRRHRGAVIAEQAEREERERRDEESARKYREASRREEARFEGWRREIADGGATAARRVAADPGTPWTDDGDEPPAA